MRQDPATVKITETDQAWFVAQKVSAERGTADTISETGHAAVCWWCVCPVSSKLSVFSKILSAVRNRTHFSKILSVTRIGCLG